MDCLHSDSQASLLWCLLFALLLQAMHMLKIPIVRAGNSVSVATKYFGPMQVNQGVHVIRMTQAFL